MLQAQMHGCAAPAACSPRSPVLARAKAARLTRLTGVSRSHARKSAIFPICGALGSRALLNDFLRGLSRKLRMGVGQGALLIPAP
jgi:hypothetical protein